MRNLSFHVEVGVVFTLLIAATKWERLPLTAAGNRRFLGKNHAKRVLKMNSPAGGKMRKLKILKYRLFLNIFLTCGVRFLIMSEKNEMEILLTVKELAVMLKLTEQTIQRYVLRKAIPFHKIMRAVRFRPSEIDLWIDKGGLGEMRNEDAT